LTVPIIVAIKVNTAYFGKYLLYGLAKLNKRKNGFIDVKKMATKIVKKCFSKKKPYFIEAYLLNVTKNIFSSICNIRERFFVNTLNETQITV
jgi:hypothetical protein